MLKSIWQISTKKLSQQQRVSRVRQQLWGEIIGLPNLKTLKHLHVSLSVWVFSEMPFPFELSNRINWLISFEIRAPLSVLDTCDLFISKSE